MVSPLARHLTRFTAETSGAILAPEPDALLPQVSLAAGDLEARLQQARAQAIAEALAAAERTTAQLKSDQAQAIASAVAAARADWVATQASALEALCRAAFDEMRDLLCSRVTDILRPMLAEIVTARAVSSLSDAVDRLVTDPSHPVLTIRGPGDLLAALRTLRGESASVLYEEAATAEIKMTAAGAHVETKLAAALAMLRAPELAETDA